VQAVILAAGESKRMYPLTTSRPKVMLPVANKPILEHLLVTASEEGVDDFIFIIGYIGDKIAGYFGNGDKWGVKISYRQQEERLGTANAVRMAQGAVGDKFLVMNGDVIVGKGEIARLAQCDGITMAVKELNDTTGLGVVEAVDKCVRHIHEKTEQPPSKLANAGIYLMTDEIFSAISQTPRSQRGEYELTQSLQLIIDRGGKVSCHLMDYWLDVSYPWDLLGANESLLSNLASHSEGVVEENVVIRGPCSIGRNTLIRSGSYISGPVMIGSNCDIGPNCYIRPATAIGDNCHIGASTEVKNSIIMQGSKIPHHNYVGDSVIGECCNLGAGTKIANLRLDKKEVVVGGVETKRSKLGAILGDRVITGINSGINVGSSIGDDVFIWPGAIASGSIDSGARVK
jgi:UDP-N-acetylglucosamine diphosphorylase/glucosamine-1-phosphate N-acetyltransferase